MDDEDTGRSSQWNYELGIDNDDGNDEMDWEPEHQQPEEEAINMKQEFDTEIRATTPIPENTPYIDEQS